MKYPPPNARAETTTLLNIAVLKVFPLADIKARSLLIIIIIGGHAHRHPLHTHTFRSLAGNIIPVQYWERRARVGYQILTHGIFPQRDCPKAL